MTSIEALEQVPGTQLQHIEPTLRQLLTDLKNAGITLHADLYGLIEHAAIAHAEIAAYKEIDPPEYPCEDMIYGDFDSLPQRVKDEIEEEYHIHYLVLFVEVEKNKQSFHQHH